MNYGSSIYGAVSLRHQLQRNPFSLFTKSYANSSSLTTILQQFFCIFSSASFMNVPMAFCITRYDKLCHPYFLIDHASCNKDSLLALSITDQYQCFLSLSRPSIHLAAKQLSSLIGISRKLIEYCTAITPQFDLTWTFPYRNMNLSM